MDHGYAVLNQILHRPRGTATVERSRALVAVREVRGSNPAVSLLRDEKDEIDHSRLDRMDGWMCARDRARAVKNARSTTRE